MTVAQSKVISRKCSNATRPLRPHPLCSSTMFNFQFDIGTLRRKGSRRAEETLEAQRSVSCREQVERSTERGREGAGGCALSDKTIRFLVGVRGNCSDGRLARITTAECFAGARFSIYELF